MKKWISCPYCFSKCIGQLRGYWICIKCESNWYEVIIEELQ